MGEKLRSKCCIYYISLQTTFFAFYCGCISLLTIPYLLGIIYKLGSML